MLSVEKINTLPGPPAIGFVLISPAQEPLHVELQAFDPQHAEVILTDGEGNILFQETCPLSDTDQRMTYAIRQMHPGTYYCEVSDGFYHQVKEVHVP